MKETALFYWNMGISVIPCHVPTETGCSCGRENCTSIGKHPRLPFWSEYQRRLPTRREIEEWWDTWPDANIGAVTGKVSGIIVLDIDGVAGYAALEAAGMPFEQFPQTPMVDTGKGIHLYFLYPGAEEVKRLKLKTAAGILPQVDIRADGGFVVLPPSLHVSGRQYAWRKGFDLNEIPMVEFPLWETLLKVGRKQTDSRGMNRRGDGAGWGEKLLAGVAEGGRNAAMTRLAGLYYGRGCTPTEVEWILTHVNQNNKPPLPEKEIKTIVESIRESHLKQVKAKLMDGTAYGGSEEEREARALSDMAHAFPSLTFLGARVILGEPMQYVVEFEEGVTLMTSSELWSAKSLKTRIAEATKIVVPNFSAKSYPTLDAVHQAILDLAIPVDAGEEATLFGELKLMLTEYLRSTSVDGRADGPIPERGPFYRDEIVWVSVIEFSRWVGQSWGGKPPSVSSIAQRFAAWGCTPKKWKAETRQRQLHGIPIELLGRDLVSGFDTSDEESCKEYLA